MVEKLVALNSVKDVSDFVRTVSICKGNVTIYSDRYVINGKSIMGLYSLDLSKPLRVVFEDCLPLEVKAGISKFIMEG